MIECEQMNLNLSGYGKETQHVSISTRFKYF